uniref:Tc1-like transposase DDE domain-containing protein n=1 Tax=Oncorhynchus tshawytscha TaxID=74940 RepID=A0AAZ3PDR9_ONCTS
MAFHASKCCRIVLCNHYVVKALSTQHMKLFAPSSTAKMLRFYSSDTQEENELQLVTLAHSIAAVTVTTQGNDPTTSRLHKGYFTKESDGRLHQMTWPPQSPNFNPIEMVCD